MPQAIVPIAITLQQAGVAIGAAFTIANATVAFLSYAAIQTAINAAISMLTPKGKTGAGRGMEVSVVDSTAEARIIYGSVRCGGVNMLPPYTSGDEGRYLHQALMFAAHEVYSFSEYYFDTDTLPAPAGTTGAIGEGLVSTGKYADAAYIRRYLGTMSQNVDFTLNYHFPTQWPSTARARGFAYIALAYDFGKGKVYNGAPQPTAHVSGAKVYDPRKDSTNGGSGAHRYATPSTWEHSNNPALCWANHKIVEYGWDLDPATDIDWPSVTTAAGICEQIVVANYQQFLAGSLGHLNNGTSAGGTNTPLLLHKTAGSGAWATTQYSLTALKKGYVTGTPAGTGTYAMFGLHTAAGDAGGTGYAAAYFMYFNSGNTISIYEAGAPVMTISSTLTTQEFLSAVGKVEYDGTYVRYYVNDVLWRTVAVATPGQSLYFNTSIYLDTTANGVYVGCERRYTCNGILLVTPEGLRDNDRKLVDAMIGHQRFVNCVWSIYAGAWTAASDTIAKEDWLSIDTIQCFAGRDSGRHNKVHSFYVDPMRNWQRVEAYARTNPTYQSDDGAESIEIEIEQPMCLSGDEAQRKAEMVLRQSRNGVKLVGTLPPRFNRLLPMDVVALTFAELGWVSKTFRILGMSLHEDGSVGVSLGEEQDTDWSEVSVAEYGANSTSEIPVMNPVKPSAPASLTLTNNINGTIGFLIGEPVVRPLGTRFKLIRSLTPSNAAVGTTVFDGDALAIDLSCPASTHYYFSQAYAGSYFSPYMPNTTGIAGLPTPLSTIQINSSAASEKFTLSIAGPAVASAGAVIGNLNVGPYITPTLVDLDVAAEVTYSVNNALTTGNECAWGFVDSSTLVASDVSYWSKFRIESGTPPSTPKGVAASRGTVLLPANSIGSYALYTGFTFSNSATAVYYNLNFMVGVRKR